jgi:hypothetical protein
LQTGASSGEMLVEVDSEGLVFTVVSLLVSLIVLFVILLLCRFMLSRVLGVLCGFIYLVFVTISVLFELNVFFKVNDPMCDSDR